MKIYSLYKLFLILLFFQNSLGNTYSSLCEQYYQEKNAKGLLNCLRNMTSSGKVGTYESLWDIYANVYKKDNGYIKDYYSSLSEFTEKDKDDGSGGSKEGERYNREHTIPKSWWGGSVAAGTQGADPFIVVPADKFVNNKRSNYPLGVVEKINFTSYNSYSKLGKSESSYGYSGIVFEPNDEVKGDFARIVFYAIAKYNSSHSWTSGEGSSYFTGNAEDNFGLTDYAIKLFTEWHEIDPPDEWEIKVNEALYEIQGNINPFIDHPEYINILWGNNKEATIFTGNKKENKEKWPLEMIPISEIFDLTYSTSYLYVSESQTNLINIYFRLSDLYYHYIYDINEEYIYGIQTKQTTVLKLEYFGSDNEYLLLNKPILLSSNLYYINEKEQIDIQIDSYDNFIILKNKDFIGIDHKLKSFRYYLQLFYYPYPPDKKNKITISIPDINLFYYEMIEISEEVIFFVILDQGVLEKQLEIYDLNKETLNISKIEPFDYKIYGLTLINLNNTLNNFVYCISNLGDEPKCFPAKYKDKKIISGKSINIFPWTYSLPNKFDFIKTYALLNDQKIAIIRIESKKIYLTIFQFKDDILILGDIVNVKIIENSSNYNLLKPFLIYYWNKGLVIYNIIEDSNNKKIGVFKYYVEETCSSFEITTKLRTKTNINFAEHISGGFNHSKSYFMITQIPILRVGLFTDNKEIMPGNTIYDTSNKFYFILYSYDDKPIVIKFQNKKSKYSCSVNINLFQTQIKIKEKSAKCYISPNRSIINNITDIDLNKTYDMNIPQTVEFNAEFNINVENEDLIYKYEKTFFYCYTYIFNQKKINCKVPINFDLFPPTSIKYEYDIYSKLSCVNDIYIGTIIFDDPYLIEIIEADNLTKISENIDKTYDASEKIEKFSIDMINYFYWLTSFTYCDDYYIESGNCCKDQILTDWEVISHANYLIKLENYLNKLGININMDIIKKQIIKNANIDENSYDVLDDLFSVYIYNYAILKSSKYKKYVFSFPGTKTLCLLLAEIIASEQVEFEGDIDIKVHKLFYMIFNKIKNDIFSEEILNDIKANKDYQIIFTGHSLGGAISTLASYYYSKFKLADNEPVLITFGQPRVGNENFARDYMKQNSNVYRIERFEDIVSMIPPIKKIEEWDSVKAIKRIIDIISAIKDLIEAIQEFAEAIAMLKIPLAKFPIAVLKKVNSIIKDEILDNLKEQVFDLIKEKIIKKLTEMYPSGYCHIGGLYVLNEDSNKFYHCKDFYNEEIKSPYCKNWGMKLGKVHNIPKYMDNHNYFTSEQKITKRCQDTKDFRFFI